MQNEVEILLLEDNVSVKTTNKKNTPFYNIEAIKDCDDKNKNWGLNIIMTRHLKTKESITFTNKYFTLLSRGKHVGEMKTFLIKRSVDTSEECQKIIEIKKEMIK